MRNCWELILRREYILLSSFKQAELDVCKCMQQKIQARDYLLDMSALKLILSIKWPCFMFQYHDADTDVNWSDIKWQVSFMLSSTSRCLNSGKSNGSVILNSFITLNNFFDFSILVFIS